MAEGGCMCGAVRFRVEGSPQDPSYCHCRMCQRAVGAPVVPWGTWPTERFTWLHGEARIFASSAKGERSFCPTCGTSLTFVDPSEPGMVDVALATLDEPAVVAPEFHIWTMSRVPWFEIGDELPQHPGSSRT